MPKIDKAQVRLLENLLQVAKTKGTDAIKVRLTASTEPDSIAWAISVQGTEAICAATECHIR